MDKKEGSTMRAEERNYRKRNHISCGFCTARLYTFLRLTKPTEHIWNEKQREMQRQYV